jgi:hypothetical protein
VSIGHTPLYRLCDTRCSPTIHIALPRKSPPTRHEVHTPPPPRPHLQLTP